jgi:hypothetical protein
MNGPQSTAFRQRLVDNTLPQSAAHYLGRRSDPLDPLAHWIFGEFVKAFINTPIRVVALPGKHVGVGDPFIDLWQADPDRIEPDVGTARATPPESAMMESFLATLTAEPERWAGFLCLQFTPGIARQFQSRVIDWEARLEPSLADIRAATSSLAATPNPRALRFRDALLAPTLHQLLDGKAGDDIDRSYINYARKRGVSVPTLALAYGYDWYRRGFAYARFDPQQTWAGLHPLRSDVIADVENKVAESLSGPEEVPYWPDTILAYIDREVLSSDPARVADLLRRLRDGVHKDSGIDFGRQMVAADSLDEPKRRELRTNAIADVVFKAGLPPQRRDPDRRAEIIDLLGTFAEEGLAAVGAQPAGRVVGEVLRRGASSRTVDRLEFRLRRRLRPRSLWRAFEIPGVPT